MKRLKLLPALLITTIILLSVSCSPKHCPTYAGNETPSDTVKDKFSNAEKTGAVLFVLFAMYAGRQSN